MKLKFLLFTMLFASILNAQEDIIRTLIISEAHVGGPGRNFAEITNMGSEAVQLSNFEFGRAGDNRYLSSPSENIRLPEKMLQPGKSFFIAFVVDFSGSRALALGLANYTPPPPSEMAKVADVQIHTGDYDFFNNQLGISIDFQRYDSISPADPLNTFFGREAFYIEQHFANGDSAIVDQVMGVWDTAVDEVEGALRNRDMNTDAADANSPGSYDVAGYQHAGSFATLIRKYSIKEGNLEFVRGNSEDDSEWIALPNMSGNLDRPQPWTYGNHGDYNLDANTLEPSIAGVEVDFSNKIITVPWGLRRPDDIMLAMKKKPGIYWGYGLSPISADSLTWGARTGDTLRIVVVGEDADRGSFKIVVEPPTTADNIVIPMLNESSGANYAGTIYSGGFGWPQVTRHENGIDTISGDGSSIVNRGLPYALRVDTLLERLEKPVNAEWEIIPVDGNKNRPDLVEGDMLKVIAENGSVKQYYIQVSNDVGNDNAALSSITWPDMPDRELFESLYGWKGDTIPNFLPNSVNYQVKLPFTVEMVPATVATPDNINATVHTKRASSLKGTQEERTTTYTVTATDDTTKVTYNVEWQPEQDPINVQPYNAEPFVSEYIMREYFGNHYLEIVNPGNQPLDMSNYMIVTSATPNPAEAIAFNPENWAQRFRKYVPGYKWVDEATWASTPGFLVLDVAVDPVVQGGDVFCLGEPSTNGWWGFGNTGWSGDDWPGAVGGQFGQSDVNFYLGWGNPWGEDVAGGYVPIAYVDGSETQFMFKILNDSVKNGLKPATDPNDFQLIEAIGNVEGGSSLFGNPTKDDGHNFVRFYRKPEINTPNETLQASFGDSPETSEWKRITRWNSGIGGWPDQWTLTSMIDYGRHYFIPSTEYLSTVSSRAYKISSGYTMEDIKGLVTGVNVSEFMGNLTKKNENQTLVVKSSADGSELAMDAVITLNDTLLVTSADGKNITKYLLEVGGGLSSDAVLTSSRYVIDIVVEPKSANDDHVGSGTVSGFEYGTALTTILKNITVPSGATLSIIDLDGGFVPLERLNFDTMYVDVIGNTSIILEVIAENGITMINYNLEPSVSSNDALLTSDYFKVRQSNRLVELVPWGISVSSLLSKVAPSTGASMKIVDKSGQERTNGDIAIDDKIVVTSSSGLVSNIYFISMLPTGDTSITGSYLAYVLSNFYKVDQVNNVIEGTTESTLTGSTLVSEFNSKITALSVGAVAVVVDADGNPKTTGDLNSGDMLKVTSADGKMEVMYTLNVDVTSANTIDSGQINLYPNPTSGIINISGVTPGGRIQVYNSTGVAIRDFSIQRNIETLSINDQPVGMYFIVISDETKMLGRYKVIRR